MNPTKKAAIAPERSRDFLRIPLLASVIAMQKPTHTRTCSTLEKIIFLYIYMSFKKYTGERNTVL
jgi:hypothetical protein